MRVEDDIAAKNERLPINGGGVVPAAKAEVVVGDVLLSLGDKPLDTRETMVAQIQAFIQVTTVVSRSRSNPVIPWAMFGAPATAEFSCWSRE